MVAVTATRAVLAHPGGAHAFAVADTTSCADHGHFSIMMPTPGLVSVRTRLRWVPAQKLPVLTEALA